VVIAGFLAISGTYMLIEGTHVWRQIAWGTGILVYCMVSQRLHKEN